MINYRVMAFQGFVVPPGHVLQLSAEQAARLAQRVAKVPGGYSTVEAVQLKRGEEFGTDSPMPKAVLQLVAPVGSSKPTRSAKRAQAE